MAEEDALLIVLSVVLFLNCFIIFISWIFSGLKKGISRDHVNENSFQNYAKFYDKIIPSDPLFDIKLNKIYEYIEKNKIRNLEEIAKGSNCTIEECVFKINYLKNKRVLGDYYIDTVNNMIIPCSKDDMRLINKYKPYIYHSHLQIDEIANMIPDKTSGEVYEDIKYLNDKKLINGIKFDEVDRKIIYYTIEKRKENEGYESLHCPNCGAINDVSVNGKARCGYCKTIIFGSKFDK